MIPITITLEPAELLYNVRELGFKLADAVTHANPEKARAANDLRMGDGTDDYIALRAMNDAIEAVRAALEEYLPAGVTAADNRIPADLEAMRPVVLVFEMPDNFNTALTGEIAALAHDAVRDHVLADWLTSKAPEQAVIYAKQAEGDLRSIVVAAAGRCRPVRPR